MYALGETLEAGPTLTLDGDITSICVNKQAGLLYVSLSDAPFYSLLVLDFFSLVLRCRVPLAAHLDVPNLAAYFKTQTVASFGVYQDKVINCETASPTSEFECHACRSMEHLQIE